MSEAGAPASRFGWAAARRMGLPGLGRRWNRSRLLVVCYHGVTMRETSDDWLMLPVAEFERQIDHLARFYELLPLDQALREMEERGLETPTAAITFDDGYANNLSAAAPVLHRLDAPATVYLVTDFLDGDGLLWTTRIEYALLDTDTSTLRVGDPGVDGSLGDTVVERKAVARRVKEYLKTVADTRRRELVDAILEQIGDSQRALSEHRLLSRAQVLELGTRARVTFGAHTRSHPILGRVSDDTVLESEIRGSVDAVRDLGPVSATFAYPNGRPADFDERAVSILRDAGVRAAVTTVEGHHRRGADPFTVPRVVVGGDMSFDTFVAAASGIRGVVRPAIS